MVLTTLIYIQTVGHFTKRETLRRKGDTWTGYGVHVREMGDRTVVSSGGETETRTIRDGGVVQRTQNDEEGHLIREINIRRP